MDDNAAKFVGDIPTYYDQGLGPIIFTDYAADMAERVAAAKPRRVLETAAGTGIVTRALRDKLSATTEIVATDLNADMLGLAKKKFRAGEAVTFQSADALALPFGDGAFDAMVCQYGVMFYPDKDKGYREAYRVLSPGGRYFFSIWDTHRHNAFARIAHGLMKELFPDNTPPFLNVPFSYQFEPIKESVGDAGFTAITARVLKREKAIPDTSAFARGMVRGNPVYDQLKARPETDPEAVIKTLASRFDAEFGKPAKMSVQAIFFEATKL
jgi:SAM-dependent methyltransferase